MFNRSFCPGSTVSTNNLGPSQLTRVSGPPIVTYTPTVCGWKRAYVQRKARNNTTKDVARTDEAVFVSMILLSLTPLQFLLFQ